MSSNLTTRIIAGLTLAFFMIIGIFFSIKSLFLLFLLINILSIWEYQDLVNRYSVIQHQHPKEEKMIMTLVSSIIYVLIAGASLEFIPIKFIALAIPIVFGLFIKELFSGTPNPFLRLAVNFTGILYITVPCALVALIANFGGEFMPSRILGILLLVWANDSGAYFVGRQFGKTPLFKRVSPNKTWEGSFGGAISVAIVAFLLGLLFPAFSPTVWMGIGIICTIFGGLGDLIESLLKRSLGVKDSGTILPGHGGILDRFDAFIFTIPFIFAFLYFIS